MEIGDGVHHESSVVVSGMVQQSSSVCKFEFVAFVKSTNLSFLS